MKTAFLIIAHEQPLHLAKLVKQLCCDWAHIFIHIDKKVAIAPFLQAVPQNDRVVFLTEQQRIIVNWGGFSQVQSILALLDVSLTSNIHFDRFCLLSGADFPIKPLSMIQQRFDSRVEYMRVDRRLDGERNNTQSKNVRFYYFLDEPSFRGASGKMPRAVYDKIPLYHGSQFWSLSAECITYIRQFLDQNPDYAAFHKHVFCSDEIFFQSIVKSSPFASSLTHDFETVVDLDAYVALNEFGCHYIDWHATEGSLPKQLDSADFDKLMQSNALFARKFRSPISDTLRHMIEQVCQ